MKNCIACNEALEDEAVFCSDCGAKQPGMSFEIGETSISEINKTFEDEAELCSDCNVKQAEKPVEIEEMPILEMTGQKNTINFSEKIIEILKVLPQSDCKECGQNTCLKFALKIAYLENNAGLSLYDCRYIDRDKAKTIYNL